MHHLSKSPQTFATCFKAARTVCALLLMTSLIPVHGTPVVACDSAGESLACECESFWHRVKCENDGLTEVPTGIPRDTQTLEFWFNDFTSITRTAFAPLLESQVSTILLPANNISSIEVGTFDWLANTLEQLALNHNKLETLAVGVFRNLAKLKDLDLDNNRISTVSNQLFRGLSKLESISLSGNMISVLPLNVFEGLPSLRKVSLARNGILDIDSILSALPSNLEDLDIGGNGLGNVLRAAMFSGFPSLTHLSLEENDIDSLPKNLFLGLDKLTVLSLHTNMLVELKRSSFGDHPMLTTFYFANNSIARVEPGFFGSFPKLTHVDLGENGLTHLPRGIFDNCHSLGELELDRNQLENLDADIFRDVDQIHSLSLQRNALKSLPSTIFRGLKLLTNLNLRDNELTVIEDGTFDGLPELEDVFLVNNPLTKITCKMFPSQKVSKSLRMIVVDCTCVWKPVFDCPEFRWLSSKIECYDPELLWDTYPFNEQHKSKDSLTCDAPGAPEARSGMVSFNQVGWIALSVLALLFNILTNILIK